MLYYMMMSLWYNNDLSSGLIWVQTVCKCYQLVKLVGNELTVLKLSGIFQELGGNSVDLHANDQLGDNCIQHFHLGRYIVGYTVGNLVLRRRASGAVKCDFRPYIGRHTSQNVNFEHGYPHSNAFLQFLPQLDLYKPHVIQRYVM